MDRWADESIYVGGIGKIMGCYVYQNALILDVELGYNGLSINLIPLVHQKTINAGLGRDTPSYAVQGIYA